MVPGAGGIDFAALSLISEVDGKHFIVEFDAEGGALNAAAKSYQYLPPSVFEPAVVIVDLRRKFRHAVAFEGEVEMISITAGCSACHRE